MEFRGLTPGVPVLRQVYGKNGLHVGDLGAERTSKADIGMHLYADRYMSRALVALGPNDATLFPAHQVPVQRELARYLRGLGASSFNPNHIGGVPFTAGAGCFTRTVDQFAQDYPRSFRALINGAEHLAPFIVSEEGQSIASKVGLSIDTTPRAVDIANNKLDFKKIARRYDIATAPGCHPRCMDEAIEDFRTIQALAKEDPRTFSGVVWAKLCRSCGGRGVAQIRTEAELVAWLSVPERLNALISSDKYEGVILEAGLRPRAVNASPNLNIFVGATPDDDIYVSGTYQILAHGSMHIGNRGPINMQNRDYTKNEATLKKVADWLRSIGYIGFAGIDLLEHENGTGYVIEINARWNGSSPAGMAHAFFADKPWAQSFSYVGKVHVPRGTGVDKFARHLDSTLLNGQPITFSPDRGGVAPINVITSLSAESDDDSAIQAVVFGHTDQEVEELRQLAEMH